MVESNALARQLMIHVKNLGAREVLARLSAGSAATPAVSGRAWSTPRFSTPGSWPSATLSDSPAWRPP